MTGYEAHAIPSAKRHGFNDGLDGRPIAERAWPAAIMPHYRAGYQSGRIAAEATAMVEALREVRNLSDRESDIGRICTAILARIDGEA